MNLLDRGISWLSPERGLKRIEARTRLSEVQHGAVSVPSADTAKNSPITNSGYSQSGASRQKKSMQGWLTDSRSPQEDIGYNLGLLRQRSRDLFMSGGIGSAAINKNRSNIVGSGLTLKCQLNFRMLGLTPEQAKEWEERTEFEFGLWASSKIDNTGLNDFYDAQRIMLTGWLLNGDSLAIAKYAPGADRLNPYLLRLQLIEADRLSNPDQRFAVGIIPDGYGTYSELENGGAIRNGIETDPSGKVIAYWFSNQYQNSNMNTRTPIKWQRIDAINSVSGLPNVLFIMDPDRAEQYRGVPYLAPVIEQVKQIARYTDAEITAAIINSFFAAFIKTESPKNEFPIGDAIPEDDQLDLPLSERLASYEMGPGTINALGVGEDIIFGDPKHPAAGFEPFTMTMSKLVGASLDMPYEVLLGVFNSSYSASRAALLQAWRVFRDRRDWFSHDFCQPVYETWLFEAIATGRIKAPGFFKDATKRKLWSQAIWIGPSPGQIDPMKEVQAANIRVDRCYSTHERETAELTGMDFDSNVEVVRRERELLNGLSPAPASGSTRGGDNRNANED